jgi:hypothetical protein
MIAQAGMNAHARISSVASVVCTAIHLLSEVQVMTPSTQEVLI